MKILVIIATTALLACGGARERPDAAPVAEVDPDRVVYRWVFAPEPEPELWVEIEMTGEQDGATEFGLNTTWGPAAEIQQSVNAPSANSAGAPLNVSEMEVVSTGGVEMAVWTVEHSPGAPLTFRWKMTNDHAARRKATRNFYGPIVRDDVVHVFGRFLVIPRMENRDVNVRMEFPDFKRLGWKVASSFHAGAPAFEQRMPVHRLQSGIFYAGKDLRISKIGVAERPVYTAISGTYRASDDELTSLIGQVVTLQRDFFDEHDVAHFVVTILPNDSHINPETPEAAEAGTSLTNGFAAFLRPTAALVSASTGYALKNLFAHEMLHQWVSGRIYLTPGPATASWLHEGFTTYMAGELMRRGEVVSNEEFLAHVNSFVTAYQTSDLRSATNAEASEAFWKGRDGHEIAYNRGAVLAAFLDREIRAVSKDERRLDHFLREMLSDAASGGPLDEARFMALVEKQTSVEFAKWFRERAIDGLAMDLPDDLFGADYRAKADSEGVVQYVESK